MKIPLAKAWINSREHDAVREVLLSGWLTDGPRNKEFEENFARFIGTAHAITVNSCASALFVTLSALGITGEVIVPSFTHAASENAIVTAGAKPVFADIDYDTCNIDVDKLESLITKRTEAIMPVHFAGQPCRMDIIMKIARKYKLVVVEDSAETIGAKYKGKVAGSFGIGCFSFFPSKNMTTGEGGMITTNDRALASRIRTLAAHGMSKSSFARQKEKRPWLRAATIAGYNFRMSNILAVIGVEQLKKIKKMNALRRQHANFLNHGLRSLDWLDTPRTASGAGHVYQMYTVKLKNPLMRDAFILELRRGGVEASVHFDPPVHLQPYYKKNYPARRSALPVTEHVAKSIVTLPMYPQLSKEELLYIIKVVCQYTKNTARHM